MRKLLSLCMGFFIAFFASSQTVRYVKADAVGLNNGTSWTNAYTDFQTAINSSSSGDMLWVAKGNYQPASGQSFDMNEGVKIYGHFAGTETALSQRNLNSIDTSRLLGNGNRVFNHIGSLTPATLLDGFVIKGGNATTFGGAMYNAFGSPTISNCIFYGNSTATGGGALYYVSCSPQIINCIFRNNSAGADGGAIFGSGSSALFANCLFYDNAASGNGSAFYTLSSAGTTITNCTFYNNTSGSNTVIKSSSGNLPAITNSIFQNPGTQLEATNGVTTTVTYSLVQGGYPGTGNIDADPVFADATNRNFRLLSCASPCVNAGNNGSVPVGITTDFYGNPRITSGVVDMGASERLVIGGKYYVKPVASGNGSGINWTNASNNLQTMIDYACAGDSVFIAAGTYTAPVTGFHMKEGVKIYGHFAGTEISLTERKLYSADSTKLEGTSGYVITNYNIGLTRASIIDGFILTGNGTTGGMLNQGNASPTISNCVFYRTRNTNGGAINNFSSSAPLIVNCIFHHNTATSLGGAIYNGGQSDAQIINCTIVYNTITGTTASTGGGAIASEGFSNPVIRNTIIWGNTATNNPSIRNTGIGTTSVSNSDVEGGYTGAANINSLPSFVDLTTNNYKLKCGSPCIDAGDNTAVPTDIASDLFGNIRIRDAASDMGAIEEPGLLASTENIATSNMNVTSYQPPPTVSYPAVSYGTCSSLIATLKTEGAVPLQNDSVNARVWIESGQPANYVKRHFQVTPQNTASTATARVTLYFTQAEFNSFNTVLPTALWLPTSVSDVTGKANLRVIKYSGVSSDGTGSPYTYGGTVTTIDPDDSHIIWNTTYNRWEVDFPVTGFSGFFVSSNNILLPVRWISVNGIINNQQQAQLNWQVEEQQVASYTIEKSTDGISFTTTGSLPSVGDGTHTYSFNESKVIEGIAYYRIAQIDIDGKTSYSRVIKLQGQAYNNRISVYPNPATDNLQIVIANEFLKSNATITDINGKQLLRIQLTKTINELSIAQYKPGIYMLKIENGAVIKIVKQ